MSLMNEFMMLIARLEIPVSEWTCFRTLKMYKDQDRTAFFFPFLAPLTLGALGALGAFFLLVLVQAVDHLPFRLWEPCLCHRSCLFGF